MEGQPWLFRINLVLFDRLTTSIERSQIQLNSSLYWIKIGPCLPEFDKKDLMHAIGATFGGILRSEINGEFCRLKVQLDMLKPLRRGIFVSTENQCKSWIPFKYEKLPTFCFGCGPMRHGIIERLKSTPFQRMMLGKSSTFLQHAHFTMISWSREVRTEASFRFAAPINYYKFWRKFLELRLYKLAT